MYADNAATTKMTDSVKNAMIQALDIYGNPSSLYELGVNSRQVVEDARLTIANCIGAKQNEIYFTSGGTESDNWAIKGTAMYDGQKRCVITSEFEHHAVLRSCESLEYLG